MGVGFEELLIIKPVNGRSHPQHTFHTAQIRDRFCIDPFTAVFHAFHWYDVIIITDQFIRFFTESGVVFRLPPVAEIAVLIIVGAGGIKGVGDLMGNGDPDHGVFFLPGHIQAVDAAAQDPGGDTDRILGRRVGGVDLLGRVFPFVLIHFLIDIGDAGFQVILTDDHHGICQCAAFFFAFDPQIGIILGLFRITDLGPDGIQLLNSLFPGGFGQEIFLLQHGPVFPDDIIRQLRDICLDISADVFLTVKLADGAGQIVFDTVISRRFVFNLALDSGSLMMQGAVQVIGVPVQQFDIFDTVLCHQIGFHTADIVFRIQVTHTGQPFRLCQVIGPGGIHLHALQHGGQGEMSLL